jgi:membrane protease YdiL (CAAX protease family)
VDERAGPSLLTPTGGSLRRRRWVTAAFAVAGAAVLGWSLNVEPGSTSFYLLSLTLAAVWTIGALASGPLRIGRLGGGAHGRRPIAAGVLVGALLAALFVLGGLVVREIPVLEDAVDGVLEYARQGAGPLVLVVTIANGVAEELFFRGALYAAVPAVWAVPATTAIYALASAASGNVMLTFAAVLLGAVTGLERRSTGGVLAPILTHVTWSVLMVLTLPPLFG